ncbi:putative phage infection protein [Bifidobacterium saguini DSM 23967]|uniref:YhgE/Pip domain-containing protein n=2 Tax=Bifidobacterium saguini TaxID=762210 RepID=A0ABX7SF31_9BIFI|nr:YhgE/Pip domain-containing protein [Bifidobacterium saguini]KFI92314.1 putative phage infection protein [Bifidobacterium saguini DSM 23967]QTB91015.1 YhgE/Pip domain-containing protein [Bifidobacterium saguini]
MRNVWKVFVRDVRRIFAVPAAVIIVLASCFVPGLYSWFNVAANLDPYANTGNVPIAVANNDRGTSVNGSELNVGNQTMKALKGNHDLGWRFVNEEQAKNGVESGEYYAAIIIPKDFSADLTSVLQGKFTRPELTFYVNEKVNTLAPRVTQSGANALEQQINESFVSTVSSTVTKTLSKEAGKMNDSLNGTANQLDKKLSDVQSSITTAKNKVGDAQTAIDDSRSTIVEARHSIANILGRSSALSASISTTASSVDSARTNLSSFQQSLNAVASQGQAGFGALSGRIDGTAGAINGNAEEISGKVSASLSTLESANDALGDAIAAMESNSQFADSDALAQAKQQQSDLASQIDVIQQLNDGIPSSIQTSNKQLSDSLNALSKKTNGLSALSANASAKIDANLTGISTQLVALSGTVSGASASLTQLDASLDQFDKTLASTFDVMQQTGEALDQINDSMKRTQADFAVLRASEAWAGVKGLANVDADQVSAFLASPVGLTTREYYPMSNYGTAIAPFFTNLACWAGAFVALTLLRNDADSEGIDHLTPKQAFLGRWLLLMIVAALQGLVIASGNLIIGIQCNVPWAYYLGTIVCSMTYISIAYSLVMMFRHIGMALSVIFLILQVPGAGGMYPIEMMPRFYQMLYPFLPFTYGVEALREAIGGFYHANFWTRLLQTTVFALVFLLLALLCRPALANLNDLFNRELSDTDLINTKRLEIVGSHRNIMITVRKMLADPTWGVGVRRRAEKFERLYPHLIRLGLHLIWLVPVVFFAVMMIVGPGISFLVVWLALIVVVDIALIIIEYIHHNLPQQAHDTTMGAEGLLHSAVTAVIGGGMNAKETH